MRIRKRQVPFPLSSLSPVPLSDPNFCRPPVVQLQLEDDTAAYYNPPSSNPPPIGGDATKEEEAAKDSPKDEIGEDGETSNYSRKSSFYNAQTEMLFQESNSSCQDGGRWFEGAKAFPLKKRRGNMERSKQEEKKMKTKTNKKGQLLQLQAYGNNNNNNNQDTEEEDEEEEEEKEIKENTSSTSTTSVSVDGSTGTGSKKKVRGGALMEGSRCSRVNGRGWRCCQQTLVGYSLCEHHLGKGRLRSMTSVRNRSIANTTTTTTTSSNKPTFSPPPQPKHVLVQQQEDDHKIEVMVSKRKLKLGVVKARTISSLLGQAATNNNTIPMVENNNE